MPTQHEVFAEALRAIGFELVILDDPAPASPESAAPALEAAGSGNGAAGSPRRGHVARTSRRTAAPTRTRKATPGGADTPMPEVAS
jgi:hypothetical protein